MSWIPRTFRALPGPLPVRIVEAILIVVVVALMLHFFYEWVGGTFLDTGGGIE
jgi:hypothetical protein